MPKLVGLLVIFLLGLIFNLSFLAAPVLAVSCRDSGIGYGPTSFPEKSGDITLNFQVANPNILNYLKGGLIRLQILSSVPPPGSSLPLQYISPPALLDQPNFSLVVTDPVFQASGKYQGSLYWQAPGQNNFEQLCTDISYKVVSTPGDLFCSIDKSVPSTIPPNSFLTVRFKGTANTSYDLRLTYNIFAALRGDIVASAITDGTGFGEFNPVQIGGKNGDDLNIAILGQGIAGALVACEKGIKLNIAANPQSSPPPKTSSTQTGSYSGPITNAANQDCQVTLGGQTYSGIQTAIGCVPVEPAGFIQAFLSLAIGVGGGIAFLMMVFGAFQMITSAGNPETLKAGQDKLTNAIIGILIIVFSVLLLKIIGVDILGIAGLIK